VLKLESSSSDLLTAVAASQAHPPPPGGKTGTTNAAEAHAGIKSAAGQAAARRQQQQKQQKQQQQQQQPTAPQDSETQFYLGNASPWFTDDGNTHLAINFCCTQLLAASVDSMLDEHANLHLPAPFSTQEFTAKATLAMGKNSHSRPGSQCFRALHIDGINVQYPDAALIKAWDQQEGAKAVKVYPVLSRSGDVSPDRRILIASLPPTWNIKQMGVKRPLELVDVGGQVRGVFQHSTAHIRVTPHQPPTMPSWLTHESFISQPAKHPDPAHSSYAVPQSEAIHAATKAATDVPANKGAGTNRIHTLAYQLTIADEQAKSVLKRSAASASAAAAAASAQRLAASTEHANKVAKRNAGGSPAAAAKADSSVDATAADSMTPITVTQAPTATTPSPVIAAAPAAAHASLDAPDAAVAAAVKAAVSAVVSQAKPAVTALKAPATPPPAKRSLSSNRFSLLATADEGVLEAASGIVLVSSKPAAATPSASADMTKRKPKSDSSRKEQQQWQNWQLHATSSDRHENNNNRSSNSSSSNISSSSTASSSSHRNSNNDGSSGGSSTASSSGGRSSSSASTATDSKGESSDSGGNSDKVTSDKNSSLLHAKRKQHAAAPHGQPARKLASIPCADDVMDLGFDDAAASEPASTEPGDPAAAESLPAKKHLTSTSSTSSCVTSAPPIAQLLAAAFAATPQHNV